jgi:hypothetical protein
MILILRRGYDSGPAGGLVGCTSSLLGMILLVAVAIGSELPGLSDGRPEAGRAGGVGAENLVHGSDRQSCSLCRLALMIAGHVPAIRLSPDHAGGLVAADVRA